MIDPLKIVTLARRAIPQGMRDLGAGAEDSIRQLVQNQITKLNLVDRQQFEQQCQLLQQARERLVRLEQQVTLLEVQLASLLSIKSCSK
jgi:ubiquinone biosynthesis accessory factor UbiK